MTKWYSRCERRCYENQQTVEWVRIFEISAPPTFVTEFSNILESLNIKLASRSRRRVSVRLMRVRFGNYGEILKVQCPKFAALHNTKAWFTRVKQAQQPPVHTREIVKQEQRKGKFSFSLFLCLLLRLLHTCESDLTRLRLRLQVQFQNSVTKVGGASKFGSTSQFCDFPSIQFFGWPRK